MSESRLAVSFGASFLGFPTHLGFLRGLVAGGWKPHAVAGSSAGALVAGLYAAGLSLEAMEAAFTRPDLKRHFRERSFPLRALGTFLGMRGIKAETAFRDKRTDELFVVIDSKDYVQSLNLVHMLFLRS